VTRRTRALALRSDERRLRCKGEWTGWTGLDCVSNSLTPVSTQAAPRTRATQDQPSREPAQKRQRREEKVPVVTGSSLAAAASPSPLRAAPPPKQKLKPGPRPGAAEAAPAAPAAVAAAKRGGSRPPIEEEKPERQQQYFRGVGCDKRTGSWKAGLRCEGQKDSFSLGIFNTALEAAKQVDRRALPLSVSPAALSRFTHAAASTSATATRLAPTAAR